MAVPRRERSPMSSQSTSSETGAAEAAFSSDGEDARLPNQGSHVPSSAAIVPAGKGHGATDLTGMSSGRVVLTVALPATAGFTLNTFFSLVDAYFIGKLGTAAMASMSSASILTWMMYSLGSLGQAGGQAFVSQAVGAGNGEMVRKSVLAALALHVAAALALLTPIFFVCDGIFSAMGLEAPVVSGASSYLRPYLAGIMVYLPGMVAMATFHAHGDTRTPMLVLAAALVLNALLDPLLIFGLGPVPGMGLFGAGLATAICKAFVSGALLLILKRRGVLDFSFWSGWRPMAILAGRIAAVGLPIAVNGIFFSGVYLALIRVISGYGTVPVATLGIVHRIENLGWFACTGFSVAAAALAGQLVGAGMNGEALRKVWRLTGWLSCILAIVCAVYVLLGGAMTGVFTDDQAVVDEGARYLRIIAAFLVFMGWELMFEAALGAVGSSALAMAVSVPLTLLRIPFAWLFGVRLGWGVQSVWWTISVSTALKGMGLSLAYSFGRWRRRGSLVARSAG